VYDEFTDTVLVGQWTGAHVDVVQTWIIDDQSDVMASVDQRTTRLPQPHHIPFHVPTTKNALESSMPRTNMALTGVNLQNTTKY